MDQLLFSRRRKGVDWLGKPRQPAGKTGTSRRNPCRTNEIVTNSVHQLFVMLGRAGPNRHDNYLDRLQNPSRSTDARSNRIPILDTQPSLFGSFRLPTPNLFESRR